MAEQKFIVHQELVPQSGMCELQSVIVEKQSKLAHAHDDQIDRVSVKQNTLRSVKQKSEDQCARIRLQGSRIFF